MAAVENRLQTAKKAIGSKDESIVSGEAMGQYNDDDVKQLNANLASLVTEYSLISNKLVEFREQILKDQLSESSSASEFKVDPNVLLAQGITRFGVVIIAIYLVQILMSLYRFNTRMAAYYRSHADALVLKSEDTNTLTARQRILLPHIDYGKTPVSVLERLAEQARAALDQVGDTLSKASTAVSQRVRGDGGDKETP